MPVKPLSHFAALLLVLSTNTGRLLAADRDPDGDQKISQWLQAIDLFSPNWAKVYGDWGGSVAVLREVARTNKWLPPDLWAIYTVDFKTRKLTAVPIPGIKEVTHLSNDRNARVVAGVDTSGAWRLTRHNGDMWQEVPLPDEVQKSILHRLIHSDGPLAIAIPEAVFRWTNGKWNKTALPPPIARLYASDRSNDVIVKSDGLLIGSTYYIGWWQQGDSTEGGFFSDRSRREDTRVAVGLR